MKNYCDEFITGRMTPEEAYIAVRELLNLNAITNHLSTQDRKEYEEQEHSLEITLINRYLISRGYRLKYDTNKDIDFGHWIKEDWATA